MKHIIIGTAGHIDHGKTALIKALTGTETDRLKEEQQRGITIDIGFASLPLSDDIEAGIIDVPGHEKFVKNMLAGIGGIDLAILVIAADEGIMPQTEEHLAICDLLHIQRGLVALTKIDLVDEEWLELVQEDVQDTLEGTFLENAPLVSVSSKTREGLEQLRQELTTLALQVQTRGTDGIFRLPIDRVFTIKGFGTVVTGTLISGSISPEDTVQLLPGGATARIRNVQVHDHSVQRASAGQRTALNLHGAEKQTVQRGMVLSEPELLNPTYMLDAFLTLLPNASKALKYRARVRFHHGTNEVMARVILFDRDELAPGESCYVQFRLEAPIVALARDRYIIRSYSPIITIGGGDIVYPHPDKHKHSSKIIDQLQALHQGSLADTLEIYARYANLQPLTSRAISGLIAIPQAAIEQSLIQLIEQQRLINTASQGVAVIHKHSYDSIVQELFTILDRFHVHHPLKSGMPKEELRKKLPADLSAALFQQILDNQIAAGTIHIEAKIVRKASYQLQLTAAQREAKQRLERLYLNSRFQPSQYTKMMEQAGCSEREGPELLRLLVDEGRLVRVNNELYYHATVFEEIQAQIMAFLQEQHEITIGDVKDLFSVSRKFAVPILTYLDAAGLTIRTGDVRVLRA